MAPTDTTPGLALSEIGCVALYGFEEYSSEPPLTSSSRMSPAVPDPRLKRRTAMFTVFGPETLQFAEQAAGHLDRRRPVLLVGLPTDVAAVDHAVVVAVDVDVVVGAAGGRPPVAPPEAEGHRARVHRDGEQLVVAVPVQEPVAVGVVPGAAPVATTSGVARRVEPRHVLADRVGGHVSQGVRCRCPARRGGHPGSG